ncbi:MAG: hypothetical protein GY810_17860 [Aureispira sp.]|nr:hypothetical protein [Aureispira sp.]
MKKSFVGYLKYASVVLIIFPISSYFLSQGLNEFRLAPDWHAKLMLWAIITTAISTLLFLFVFPAMIYAVKVVPQALIIISMLTGVYWGISIYNIAISKNVEGTLFQTYNCPQYNKNVYLYSDSFGG